MKPLDWIVAIVGILYFWFFVGCFFLFHTSELQRCKNLYSNLVNSEDFVRLEEELAKQGTTFDERLEQNCRMWIKNGQRF